MRVDPANPHPALRATLSRKRERALAVVVLLAACTALPPPAPAPVPHAQRVVLISFDGLAADGPELPSMPRDGFVAKHVIPVTPTQTSSTHVAILTGQEPNVTGIVGNRFKGGDGFTTDIDAETIVEAARHRGKRVGSIAFPTVDGRNERRSADFGLVWTMPLERARTIHLTRADFRQEWVPPGWTATPTSRHSFSPVMRARIDDLDVVGYDTTDDQVHNYNSITIERDEHEIPRDENGWFAISERVDGALHGSWSKLIRATPTLDDVTIYWGPVSTTAGYPESFRKMIDDEVGFWPGPPGEGVDAETFAQQNDRLSRFLTTVTATAIKRMDFDLLLAYQPVIDAEGHQFDSTRAYELADRAVGTIASLLDPSHDALIVTGDHGLAAVDTELRVNRLLAEWGFDWEAYANGMVAHLYGSDRPDELVARLLQSGYFEQVTRRGPDWHPNSGDVVAYSYPHIALTIAEGDVVRKPPYRGQHGGLSWHPEFHTRLYAWGSGVEHRTVDEMPQTAVAPFTAALLGITILPAPAGTSTAPRESPLPRSPAPAPPITAARPSSPATSD